MSNRALSEFASITGVALDKARQYMEFCGHDLSRALHVYFETAHTVNEPSPSALSPSNFLSPPHDRDRQEFITLEPSGEDKVSVLVREYVSSKTGRTLQVRHGDMTEERVGVIVNAANKNLDHGSGLAGAIRKKGGDVIQIESEVYIRQHGVLEEGAVVALSAGNLPSHFLMHAVGPVWDGGRKGETIFLTMCVRGCLDKATELGVDSIALPAISTGIFKFPKTLCAEIMFDTVVAFVEDVAQRSSLMEIRFTNFDDITVHAFAEEFDKRFGNGAQEGSGEHKADEHVQRAGQEGAHVPQEDIVDQEHREEHAHSLEEGQGADQGDAQGEQLTGDETTKETRRD